MPLKDEILTALRLAHRGSTDVSIERWKTSLGSFLQEAYWTRDPKRKRVLRYPAPSEREDLYAIARILDAERATCFAKSRQQMDTNTHLGEIARDVVCWQNTVWLIASMDYDMSKALVNDQLYYSFEMLPEGIRSRYRIEHFEGKGRIDVISRDGESWDSSIIAIERGQKAVRQRTLSGIFLDEFGDQYDALNVYSTALAQVQEEGEFTGKMRVCGTIQPDSEHLKMLGPFFKQHRTAVLMSGVRQQQKEYRAA